MKLSKSSIISLKKLANAAVTRKKQSSLYPLSRLALIQYKNHISLSTNVHQLPLKRGTSHFDTTFNKKVIAVQKNPLFGHLVVMADRVAECAFLRVPIIWKNYNVTFYGGFSAHYPFLPCKNYTWYGTCYGRTRLAKWVGRQIHQLLRKKNFRIFTAVANFCTLVPMASLDARI